MHALGAFFETPSRSREHSRWSQATRAAPVLPFAQHLCHRGLKSLLRQLPAQLRGTGRQRLSLCLVMGRAFSITAPMSWRVWARNAKASSV